MWCPNCMTEREPKNSRCDVCGAELAENLASEEAKASWNLSFQDGLMKKWPHDVSGQPEEPVFLTHCTSTNMEDRIIINMLDAYGIPVVKNFPQNGCFGKVVLGISADGADIFVPASMLEDAKALLEDSSDD